MGYEPLTFTSVLGSHPPSSDPYPSPRRFSSTSLLQFVGTASLTEEGFVCLFEDPTGSSPSHWRLGLNDLELTFVAKSLYVSLCFLVVIEYLPWGDDGFASNRFLL